MPFLSLTLRYKRLELPALLINAGEFFKIRIYLLARLVSKEF